METKERKLSFVQKKKKLPENPKNSVDERVLHPKNDSRDRI